MYIKQLGSDLLSSSVLNQKQHTNLKQSVLFTQVALGIAQCAMETAR